MIAHLDLTDALRAHGGAEMNRLLDHLLDGPVEVYRASWLDGERRAEGFVSASSAEVAHQIVVAHELGFGRSVDEFEAAHWGTRDELGDWARSRCS